MIVSLVACLVAAPPTNSVLVLDGVVLGCLTENGWRSYRSVSPLPSATMSAVGIGRPGEDVLSVSFEPSRDGLFCKASGLDRRGVYYSTEAAYPRSVIENTNDRSYYFPIIARFLRSQGEKSPRSYIVHVWGVNLDDSRDGEEIVEAVSRPEVLRGEVQPGDWEAVLLRYRDESGEKVVPLHSSFSADGRQLRQCRLRAVADFGGDGAMEFVTSAEDNRGKSATLWSFQKGRLTALIDFDYSRTPAQPLGF